MPAGRMHTTAKRTKPSTSCELCACIRHTSMYIHIIETQKVYVKIMRRNNLCNGCIGSCAFSLYSSASQWINDGKYLFVDESCKDVCIHSVRCTSVIKIMIDCFVDFICINPVDGTMDQLRAIALRSLTRDVVIGQIILFRCPLHIIFHVFCSIEYIAHIVTTYIFRI